MVAQDSKAFASGSDHNLIVVESSETVLKHPVPRKPWLFGLQAGNPAV